MFRLALHWQIFIAVGLGALIGLTLNFAASKYETEPFKLKKGHDFRWQTSDTTDRVVVEILNSDDEVVRRWIVDPLVEKVDSGKEKLFPSVDEFAKYANSAGKESDDRIAYQAFDDPGRSTARVIGDFGGMVGRLFIRMLQMVSVPLVIASLLTGIMGLSTAAGFGRMFGRTILYYVCTSLIAVATGLTFVNLIRPGDWDRTESAATTETPPAGDLGETLYNQIQTLIPPNPVEAVADGNFLSIIAFTILFGLFAVKVGGPTLKLLSGFAQALFDVMMAMTMAIIQLAPYGVFFLMLNACATLGIGVFQKLGLYLVTLTCGLAFHALVTLPLIVWFIGRRSPWLFAQAMSPALLTAFSSASSNATLPLTLTSIENRAGISNRVGSFVLPLGATINMDGTALFEVVAVLFIAQWEPGINLTIVEQITVAFTALMASIGAAGIPSAGLIMMVIVLQAVGLGTDKVALILAVDRVLDMCRTAVNVWSDSCGCAVIARFESEDQAEVDKGTPVTAADQTSQPGT